MQYNFQQAQGRALSRHSWFQGSLSDTLDSAHEKPAGLDKYSVPQQLWECVLDNSDCVDPDLRAPVLGVQAQMESFHYFFGICVSKLVLGHGDNLSAALQSSAISAVEGQRMASMTACTIAKVRTDESFSLFWIRYRGRLPQFMSPNLDFPNVERCLCGIKPVLQHHTSQLQWKLITARSILKLLIMLSPLSRQGLINHPTAYAGKQKTFLSRVHMGKMPALNFPP